MGYLHRYWSTLALLALLLLAQPGEATAQSGNGATPHQTKPLIQWRSNQGAQSSTASQSTPSRMPVQDTNVLPATHEVPAAPVSATTTEQRPASEFRRLAPHSGTRPLDLSGVEDGNNKLPFSAPKLESLSTAGAGLAIVVGLFLLCAWLFRRSGPKPTSPLPKDAAAVLGRMPLAGNHFAHLVKLGNKLVLVSVGPDSVTTLAEVDDANEVQRLLALCLRGNPTSTSAEFQQVLEQLAAEPAQGFLDRQTSPPGQFQQGRA